MTSDLLSVRLSIYLSGVWTDRLSDCLSGAWTNVCRLSVRPIRGGQTNRRRGGDLILLGQTDTRWSFADQSEGTL